MTPLEMAVQGGKSACVEALTAHFLSAAEGRLEVLTSCLKMATIHGQVSVLEPLLTCRDKMTGGPRDVIVSDRGDTLAHLAAKQAHVNVLQLLAAKGYDVTKRNKDGAAAIDVSRAVRSLTCFRFLLPFHVSTSVLRHSVSMATTNQRLLSTQDAVMKDLETIQKEIEAASSTNHRQASTQRQRLTECRKVLASSLEMTSSSDRHGVLGDVRRDLHYCLQLLEEVESQQPMGSLDRLAAQWGQDLGELVEELRLAKTFPHEKTDGVDGRVFSHVLRRVSKMRDWQEKSLDDFTHLVVMDTALSLSNVTSPGKTAGSNGRSTGNESDGDSSTSTLKAGGMRSGWQHESDSESTVVALDRLRMRKRRRFRDDVSSSERSAATVADSEDWLLGGQSELSGSSRTVTSYSEESSYYSDEDDVSDHVVRLNLQNEDAEQDDLRIQRLEKHLDDIQRLNAASSDVIETIVTATGERIPGTSAVTGRRQNSRQPDGNRAGRGQAAAGAGSSKPTKTPGKFFKAREAPKPRELTPSEFMECFDRTGDVTILHRRQQELDLPWQELHFSDAEDDKPEKPWYEISEDEEGLQERRSGTSGHSSDEC